MYYITRTTNQGIYITLQGVQCYWCHFYSIFSISFSSISKLS